MLLNAFSYLKEIVTALVFALILPDLHHKEATPNTSAHTGGYAVLKGLQKGLSLPTEKMIPSFACLSDYG